jgi:hypothetical protein
VLPSLSLSTSDFTSQRVALQTFPPWLINIVGKSIAAIIPDKPARRYQSEISLTIPGCAQDEIFVQRHYFVCAFGAGNEGLFAEPCFTSQRLLLFWITLWKELDECRTGAASKANAEENTLHRDKVTTTLCKVSTEAKCLLYYWRT